MDFRLTDDQFALQEAVRGFCEVHHPLDRIGERDQAPLRRDTWQRLADLDVFRLTTDEALGGLGLGLVEQTVVYEALGAHLVPGPLVWSAICPARIAGLASGDLVVGGIAARDTEPPPALVEHGTSLDALVVLHDDAVHLVDVGELELEPTEPIDPLTPVAFARRLPSGRPVAGPAEASALRTAGTILSAALLTGIADRAVAAGVAYAGERQQFDRPIGSFQAIKHLLADAYVRTSLARSATYAAAAFFDDPDAGDADRACAAAKLLAADAAVRNARACIQVHGGMGFTWDMLPHYLLKRAWVLERGFGDRDLHATARADALEQELVR